jgi:hypothetical protein
MAVEALRGIARYPCSLIVALRKDHVSSFGGLNRVRAEFERAGFDKLWFVELDPTVSQVDTVLAVLERQSVFGSFTIKDCDNKFDLDLNDGNSVAVYPLTDAGRIDAGSLSYVCEDNNGIVQSIVEKQVISDRFCCGSYTFESSALFRRFASGLGYISEVVGRAIFHDVIFRAERAYRYTDWGTAAAWGDYCNSFKTMFIDIDGVLLHSSHRSFAPSWYETGSLRANVDYLRRLDEQGRTHIVLTTSRPEKERSRTREQLLRQGIPCDQLVMGLPVCSRVVVNDYVKDRGQHTCFAVNIERDGEQLEASVRATLREHK